MGSAVITFNTLVNILGMWLCVNLWIYNNVFSYNLGIDSQVVKQLTAILLLLLS